MVIFDVLPRFTVKGYKVTCQVNNDHSGIGVEMIVRIKPIRVKGGLLPGHQSVVMIRYFIHAISFWCTFALLLFYTCNQYAFPCLNGRVAL